jgi:hypothetical protein
MQNLIFFDKEGNPLNFYYNETVERYEGDILFPVSSSDTFKTQVLYLFEKIPAFEYENNPNLSLRKWQLFNEYGFHFYQGTGTFSITKIEPVNQEESYYSKWIYGKNIEAKFKLGTFIKFNSSIFEFTDPNRVYSVVGSKKNAILILSNVNNLTFELSYSGSYGLTSSYDGVTIKGVDIIGIYNYITPQLSETLSVWNEPSFYDRLYQYRKLNIINTDKNDSYRRTGRYDDVDVVTIKNPEISDIVHFEYNLPKSSLPNDSTLFIEVITRTDLPRVYRGGLSFDSIAKRLNFLDPIPDIIRPGMEFKVSNSVLNTDFYKVSNISTFLGNVNLTYYATGSQVLYNNTIYQCIQAYTWSGATESVNPVGSIGSDIYWGSPTYLPIEPSSISGGIVNEFLVGGELYFTSDHIYFTQSFTQSSEITLASAAERFKSEFKVLKIDLYYEDSQLKADLIYPSKYAIVNYYYDQVSSTHSIGQMKYVYERCIETYEPLVKEFNYNYSSNWNYNIVFTDIDEFGIIVKINKMVYKERVAWIYSSGLVDMQRTIDRTLRNWLTRHFMTLNTLGILPTLNTVGYSSVYYNAITLSTDFPNVPIDFSVQVGTTGDFYIEHTVVVFNTIGKYLTITVNGRGYEEPAVVNSINGITDISTTLANWVESWAETINDFGIYVSNSASSLKFNVKKQIQRVSLKIEVGISSLPGIENYQIIKKYSGNLGALITSNEIILATSSASLEEVGFATGQVIGINKTYYTLQNIEYNSLYLNPDVINLSYEGPFWGLTDSLCNSSAFTTVAFTIGFSQSVCPPSFVPSLIKGMYDKLAFTASFSIEYMFSNTYIPYEYGGVNGMVDIVYVEPANSIYVLGEELRVYNSNYATVITDITIDGLTNSISLCYNHVSSYLYALSRNALFQIDPYINLVIASYSFASDAYSIKLNSDNGDIYVSFENSTDLYVYPVNQSIPEIVDVSPYYTYNMAFNEFETDMYITTNLASILRINGDSRTIQSTYPILAATHSIEYDPENEAIYVMADGSNLKKIDNNVVVDLPSITAGTFDSMIFNNLTSTMNISSDSGFSSILVDNDVIYFTSTPIGYGEQALSQFDGDIYVGIDSQILVVDSATGQTKKMIPFSGGRLTKLIYNPDRRSIWSIQPSTEKVVEIQVQLGSYFTLEPDIATQSTDNFYGTLDPNYVDKDYLWLNVREYIRRPRENFNGGPTVSLYFKWFSDNVPQFFMYEFSGSQLTTSGILAYTGEKPLPTVHLNRRANRDITKTSIPEYQQTIFDIVEHDLEFIDDNEDVSVVPEPIELFLGFNSPDEGGLRSVLQLYKKEKVDFTITTTSINNDIIRFENIIDEFTLERYGRISLSDESNSYFTFDSNGNGRGLKVGQHLAIFVKDVTNTKKQYISNNNGYLLKIRAIYSREILVDYFKEVDALESESSVISSFPKTGQTTYLSTRFVVWNREIGRFNVFGQTEIEDIRFHTELNNVGKLISSDDVYIFKEYDIKEEGIDWDYLNMKRKEMLMVKNLIFPYIGSYKSIINAINYFGYNDLELYEYYRNVDIESENYYKLFKVEIPDIFDNTVEGWKDNDFIKHLFPNDKYQDTNLFNLTYRITDKEGNNILYYTVEEVQKKLQGLKYWLQKNIIPITHKILDITGRADFVGDTVITHQTRDAQIFNVRQNFTPIMFDMNEAYLLPVNSGSTVYNCVIDFYILGSATSSLLPDYYTVDIRTYEIYREWYAFRNYQIGERVVYYDKLYESVIPNNKTNNPRKFENAELWLYGTSYKIGDVVNYNRLIYVWTGQAGSTFSAVSPILDEGVANNWLDITEWKQIDLMPVDRISEYRHINNLYPFNFTVDSNITPYLVIEVTSENGYGAIYRDRKNFEIKGILDIQEIEAFSNLTTKQYRDATLPVVYVDLDKAPDLNFLSYPFTYGFLDRYGNYTDRPYISKSGDIVYPNIKHAFPYKVENNSSFVVSSFTIELSDDFIYMKNPYVITDKGGASVFGNNLNWSGNLLPGATVSFEIVADVTKGGKANWRDPVNSADNDAFVPIFYRVGAKLVTGQNYGVSYSTAGSLHPNYRYIYTRSASLASRPAFATQSFSNIITYGVGNTQQFILSTFSQYDVSIVRPGSNIVTSTNFGDLVRKINTALGSWGYSYYHLRTNATSHDNRILISTYYQSISSTQSWVLRYQNGSLSESDGPNLLTDTPGFDLGTNSSAAGWMISGYYYP